MNTITRRILAYWEAHPHAADSAVGICRWWLGAAGTTATLDEVEQALEEMVSAQQARRATLADGTTLYSRGPRV